MIPVFEPSFSEEDAQAVSEVIRGGYINEADRTKEFEKRFAEFVGSRFAVATTSGTMALFMALKVLGVKYRDTVIIPDYTAIGIATAVRMTGATLLLVDVDDRGNLEINEVIQVLNTRSLKAIIAVHNNGLACAIHPSLNLGVPVVEDAAQCIGSRLAEKHLGTYAKIGCFSLATTKIITSGQGGVVVTDDEETYWSLQAMKNQGNIRGIDAKDYYPREGYNLKFDEMKAAFVLSQMNRLDERIQHMKDVLQRYRYYFKDLMPVTYQGELEWRATLQLPEKVDRELLRQRMKEQDIEIQPFFKPLHEQPLFKPHRQFSEATKFSYRGVYLPSSPTLQLEQVDIICEKLKELV